MAAIAAGQLDPPQWVRITIDRIELEASADWLSIGGERVPMSAPVAQAAVSSLDALLPTDKIVDAIERDAFARGRIVPFTPWPRWQDNSQLWKSTILWREQKIAEQLGHVAPGTLIAGPLKDVVLAGYMPRGRVVIYGGLDAEYRRVQSLHPFLGGALPGHLAGFDGGYAHGTRAVRDACLFDGRPARLSEVLSGGAAAPLSEALCNKPLLSALGGPVAAVRYPKAATPGLPAGAPPVTATSSPQTTRLVDVSLHQRAAGVDWRALRALGIEGMIARATMGATGVDEAFHAHIGNAAFAGVVPIAAYHFFHHDKDPRIQAAHLCRTIGDRDLAPVVDVEWKQGEDARPLSAAIRARVAESVPIFVREVEQLLGRPCIIYTSPGYAEQIGWQEAFGLLWIAAYDRAHAPRLLPWEDWLLWQHKVAPLAGLTLDQNVFRGTLQELRMRLARGS